MTVAVVVPERDDHSLGTHRFVKIGLGQYYRSGDNRAVRLELFYKHVFNKDLEVGRWGISTIEFDAAWAGFEITYVFGL